MAVSLLAALMSASLLMGCADDSKVAGVDDTSSAASARSDVSGAASNDASNIATSDTNSATDTASKNSTDLSGSAAGEVSESSSSSASGQNAGSTAGLLSSATAAAAASNQAHPSASSAGTISDTSSSTTIATTTYPDPVPDGKLVIAVLGDSQMHNGRGTGTAVPEYLSALTNADVVWNLAVPGSTASLSAKKPNLSDEEWEDANFIGVIKVLQGKVDKSIMNGYDAQAIVPEFDASKVDYYIINYGYNDYQIGAPMAPMGGASYDFSTYSSAMHQGLSILQEMSPKAHFVICSPCYAVFYDDEGKYIGDGNTVDKGAGTLSRYAEAALNIGKEQPGKYIPIDCYFGSLFDLNGYTTDDYLNKDDGVHLTKRGRHVLATAIAHFINKDLGRTNAELGVLQISDFS